jgi:hypothetical protein
MVFIPQTFRESPPPPLFSLPGHNPVHAGDRSPAIGHLPLIAKPGSMPISIYKLFVDLLIYQAKRMTGI